MQLSSDQKIDQESVREFLKDRLAPYKLPAQIIAMDKFPLTFSGKILKRELLQTLS